MTGQATITARVLDLLSFARYRERNVVASLSEAERAATGAPDHWAPKDRIVSVMRWRELQTDKLARAARGETPPDYRDSALSGRINADTFAQYQYTPLAEIEIDSERAYQGLVAQVKGMTEDELASTDRYEWAEGEALWEETLGNGLWYPVTQLQEIAFYQGNREMARRLQDGVIAAARTAALPGSLGGALYNAACFYAMHGWPEKALALLPEALHEHPSLVEWSRHDSDLDSVRADPRFQALYDNAPEPPVTSPDDLIAPHALAESLETPEAPLVIDVRGPSEYASGHVAGAVNIPLGQLARKAPTLPHNRVVVTYCNMHHRGVSRGERASAQLRALGFTAATLDGGFPAWQEAGLATG